MAAHGGIIVKGDILNINGTQLLNILLDDLRAAIRNYYGAINEVRAQVRSANNMPEKPEALLLFEQCREMKIPLVSGGIMEQPHIWMQEYAVCAQELQLLDASNRRAEHHASVSGGNEPV